MKRVLIALFVLLASVVTFAKKHEDAGPCTKNISVSAVMKYDGKIHPFMADWVEHQTKSFSKKNSDVCFSQEPQAGLVNYVVILSASANTSRGVQLVHHTDTSTATTPVSGSGTVSGNGETWNYTYDGTVTTTTTTTTTENAPYAINTNVLYATAYDGSGGIVGQRNHVYETQMGGDSNQAFGRNLGNSLRAINARGRMLTGIFEDVQKSKSRSAQQQNNGDWCHDHAEWLREHPDVDVCSTK
jgi:hypothetical protein